MRSSSLMAFAAGAAAQFPPTWFGFPTAPVQLGVQFPRFNVTQGDHVGINYPNPAPLPAPIIHFPQGDQSQTYVVMMVDPDDPMPEAPTDRFVLHWLQLNNKLDSNFVLQNQTAPQVPFRRPETPQMANPHRYTQYLFKQPAGYQVPDAYKGFSADNRMHFNFFDFVRQSQFEAPVAGNFFYSQNRSQVPGDFFAGPDGAFPAGISGSYVVGNWQANATGSATAPVYTGAASSATASSFGLALAAAVAVFGF